MNRTTLVAWIGMMAVFGVVLVVLGAVRGQPVILVVGLVFLGAQGLKWRLLRRDEARAEEPPPPYDQ